MRIVAFICLGMLLAGGAQAADVTVSVRTAQGAPVPDAVVTVAAGTNAPDPRFPWPMQVAQKDLQFRPFVLVVPAGGQVSFPNQDGIRHHVYSFSPAKRFELKLYGQGQAPSVTFDKTGVVALGCNIHDGMVAFIKVVDTPYAAKTDAAGQATLRGLPNGQTTVRIWHPYLRAPDNEIARPLAVRDGATLSATVDLRRAPLRHGAY